MSEEHKWPGPRGRERSMSLAQFEVFQQTQAKLKADREAKEKEAADAIERERAADAERIARLEGLLTSWLSYGCPGCGGDCASANPPVALCIVQETRAALAQEPSP